MAKREQTMTRGENGKYESYPTCEVCGKPQHPKKYYSDHRCDMELNGLGLVLCKKCCEKGQEMSLDDAKVYYSRK